MSKKDKQAQIAAPCEDSLPLRIVAFAMSLLCIGISIYYVPTPLLLAILYFWVIATGSYLSYIYRTNKHKWQIWIVYIGVIIVGINCWNELRSSMMVGEFTLFTPMIHFVIGTLAMQSFELRSRSDIHSSTLVGLVLLCMLAPMAKSIIFGACILMYVTLGAALLYYDCLSQTISSWIVKPIKQVTLEPTRLDKSKRYPGNLIATIGAIPLTAILLFLMLPRADALIDRATAYLQSLGKKSSDPLPMVNRNGNQKPKPWRPPQNSRLRPFATKQARPNTNWRNNASQPKTKLQTKGNLPTKKKQIKPSSHNKPNSQNKPNLPNRPNQPKTKEKPVTNKGGKNLSRTAKTTQPQKTKKPDQTAKQKPANNQRANNKSAKVSEEGTVPSDKELRIQQKGNTSNELLLKVSSTRTEYYRLYCFDTFDGKVWTASDQSLSILSKESFSDFELGAQKPLQLTIPAVAVVQRYTVMHDLTRNIPGAWVPQSLAFNTHGITVDNYGAVRLENGELKKGMKFQITSKVPIYDLNVMRAAQPLTDSEADDLRSIMPQFLQVPENLSGDTVDLSKQLTATGTNWFAKTELIVHYLQTNYHYTLDKTDESSDAPLDDFILKKKKGDCKDFGSALAIMTRCIGIPSRLVAGYAPGNFNPVSGMHEIKVQDRHVWTEVYIPQYGWVPFDSTPQGYMPGKQKEKAYDLVGLQEAMQKHDRLANPQNEGNRRVITPLDIMVCILDAAVIGICALFLVRAITKAIRKLRDEQQGRHPAMKYMKQVEKDLKALKISKGPSDTATELQARVATAIADQRRLGLRPSVELPDLVEQFMKHYYAAYFGNKERTQQLEELSHRIHATVNQPRDR